MNMNLKLNDIKLINNNYTQTSNYPIQNKTILIQTYIQQFINSTIELKTSQTRLSIQTAGLSLSSRDRINPNNVILQYEDVVSLPS